MADSHTTGGGNGNGKHLKLIGAPPPPATPRTLNEGHLAQLHASGLTDETIALAGLYTEHVPREIAALLQRKSYPRACLAAIVFPFFVPGAAEPVGYRVRPTVPRKDKRDKPIKYDQAPGTEMLCYFAPRALRAAAYAERSAVLFWTEGEKKALALDQCGLTCVGLTGVSCWHDKPHRDESGEWRLSAVIREHVAVSGRDHVICFDADAKENEQVMRAAQRLAGVLAAAGASSVRFITPPSTEHKGIDDYLAAFGAEVTLALLAKPGEIEPLDPATPLQLARKLYALRDAPVSDALRLPDGYEVHRDGTLWRLGDTNHGDTKIAPSCILPARYLDDYYTHEARTEIAYEREGAWCSMVVGRKALADARTMVAELAGYGAPVTSNSAAKLVDWIEEIGRVNVGRIERLKCVARAGWHTIEGERVFVLDVPIFEDDDRQRPLELDTRGDRKKMFAALEPRGSFEKHLAALRRAWAADPVCAAMICGSLAATLLEPLGAPNFAIHLPGDSSRGKTSMLKVAASVFGDPHSDAWVASWNATAVAIELRAAVLTDLPQCYDEAGASDPIAIERMVYMLVNGGGRSRGQRDLTLRETPSWRTVVLSTGERELADEAAATGAQVRVVQLPVSHFGTLTAPLVDELRETCAANAGSFGRAWIEQLLAIDDWEPHRESLRQATKVLRAANTDPLQSRIATYFAVLMVAEGLAAQLGLGDEHGATIRGLFGEVAKREPVQSLAERAAELVQGWVLTEPDAFPVLEVGATGEAEEPHKTHSSRARCGFRRDSLLLLIPIALRSFCVTHRLSPREVVREWNLRGWLQHDTGNLTKTCRVGGATPRLYVLDLDAIARCEP